MKSPLISSDQCSYLVSSVEKTVLILQRRPHWIMGIVYSRAQTVLRALIPYWWSLMQFANPELFCRNIINPIRDEIWRVSVKDPSVKTTNLFYSRSSWGTQMTSGWVWFMYLTILFAPLMCTLLNFGSVACDKILTRATASDLQLETKTSWYRRKIKGLKIEIDGSCLILQM